MGNCTSMNITLYKGIVVQFCNLLNITVNALNVIVCLYLVVYCLLFSLIFWIFNFNQHFLKKGLNKWKPYVAPAPSFSEAHGRNNYVAKIVICRHAYDYIKLKVRIHELYKNPYTQNKMPSPQFNQEIFIYFSYSLCFSIDSVFLDL